MNTWEQEVQYQYSWYSKLSDGPGKLFLESYQKCIYWLRTFYLVQHVQYLSVAGLCLEISQLSNGCPFSPPNDKPITNQVHYLFFNWCFWFWWLVLGSICPVKPRQGQTLFPEAEKSLKSFFQMKPPGASQEARQPRRRKQRGMDGDEAQGWEESSLRTKCWSPTKDWCVLGSKFSFFQDFSRGLVRRLYIKLWGCVGRYVKSF